MSQGIGYERDPKDDFCHAQMQGNTVRKSKLSRPCSRMAPTFARRDTSVSFVAGCMLCHLPCSLPSHPDHVQQNILDEGGLKALLEALQVMVDDMPSLTFLTGTLLSLSLKGVHWRYPPSEH